MSLNRILLLPFSRSLRAAPMMTNDIVFAASSSNFRWCSSDANDSSKSEIYGSGKPVQNKLDPGIVNELMVNPEERNIRVVLWGRKGIEENMGRMTLADARVIAKQQGLKLADISMTLHNSVDDVYKLVTGKELAELRLELKKLKREGRLNKSTASTSFKKLKMSYRIGHFDLETRVQTSISWLNHGYSVDIVIEGSDSESIKKMESLESIFVERTVNIAEIERPTSKLNQKRFVLHPIGNVNDFYNETPESK